MKSYAGGCVECGYPVTALPRCPECGLNANGHELQTPPSNLRIGWLLIKPYLLTCGGIVAAFLLMGICIRTESDLLKGLSVGVAGVLYLILIIVLLVCPFDTAKALTVTTVPRHSRRAWFYWLLIAGWASAAVVMAGTATITMALERWVISPASR